MIFLVKTVFFKIVVAFTLFVFKKLMRKNSRLNYLFFILIKVSTVAVNTVTQLLKIFTSFTPLRNKLSRILVFEKLNK